MAKLNPMQFIDEVRQEVAKVTWPSVREVRITTLVVIAMVALAALFFAVVDKVIFEIVQRILGFK